MQEELGTEPLPAGGPEPAAGGTERMDPAQAALVAARAGREGGGRQPRRKERKPLGFWALAAIALVAIAAAVAWGIHSTGATATLAQIDATRVQDDVRTTEGFLEGIAADDFVEAAPYAETSLVVDAIDGDNTGATAKATATIENGWFAQTRTYTVRYERDGDEWAATVQAGDAAATPLQGICRDEDFGIGPEQVAAGLVVFDAQEATCVATTNAAREDGPWFAETAGTRLVRYAFDGTAWQRVKVDDSLMTTSYDKALGTYVADAAETDAQDGADASAGGIFGLGAEEDAGHLAALSIDDVNNSTGAFTGTFTWEKAGSGLFGAGGASVAGTATGTLAPDGSIDCVGEADDGSASITIAGKSQAAGTFDVDWTVHRKTKTGIFGTQEQMESTPGSTRLAHA